MKGALRVCQWGLLATLAALTSACGNDEPPPPSAISLPAVVVSANTSPLSLTYTARTRGAREVEVRARVSGILLRRYYREGAVIAAGDRLFQIDPQPFKGEVNSAKGRLGIAEARLNAATRQWRRVAELSDRGFMSAQNRDDAEADFIAGKAAVTAARADLDRAQLNLGYTDVRAPIGGVTGREARSEGSLVNADDDTALLTTITQTDRLDIEFAIPEAEAQLLRASLRVDPDRVRVRVISSNDDGRPELARIDFVSARVASNTDTVDVRATLDNRETRLAPGQFVRAELTGLHSVAGIYVPARAVLHGAEGPYVWKIDSAGKAQIQPIKLGPSTGNLLRIDGGLKPRDMVIIDGVLKLQPNMAVKPTPVALGTKAGSSPS